MVAYGVRGTFMCECITFAIGMVVTLLITIPDAKRNTVSSRKYSHSNSNNSSGDVSNDSSKGSDPQHLQHKSIQLDGKAEKREIGEARKQRPATTQVDGDSSSSTSSSSPLLEEEAVVLDEEARPTVAQLWLDALVAWKFICQRPALLALLGLLICGHFASGLIQMLFVPLVLNIASTDALGNVLTCSGCGAIVGSLLLAAYGRPITHKSQVVLWTFGLQGLLLMALGLQPNLTLIFAVAFLYMASIPVARTCREAIWQTKTPPEMQGRVFALQRGLSEVAMPTAAILAGPLADLVFEPLLASEQAALGSSLGRYIGVGPGRGSALFFLVIGLGNVALALAGSHYRPLWLADTLLPDAANINVSGSSSNGSEKEAVVVEEEKEKQEEDGGVGDGDGDGGAMKKKAD
jgi:hypothetical protein